MHDVSAVCLHWNRLSLSPTTDRLVLVSVPKTAPLCPNVAVGTSVLFSLAFSSPEIWTANEVLALSSHESTALSLLLSPGMEVTAWWVWSIGSRKWSPQVPLHLPEAEHWHCEGGGTFHAL